MIVAIVLMDLPDGVELKVSSFSTNPEENVAESRAYQIASEAYHRIVEDAGGVELKAGGSPFGGH